MRANIQGKDSLEDKISMGKKTNKAAKPGGTLMKDKKESQMSEFDLFRHCPEICVVLGCLNDLPTWQFPTGRPAGKPAQTKSRALIG